MHAPVVDPGGAPPQKDGTRHEEGKGQQAQAAKDLWMKE